MTDTQRDLLLDIRREHRSASVPLIIATLEQDGRLERDIVSAATVRRLYAEHGLRRIPARRALYDEDRKRLRWEALRPGALWQGDVCHGPALTVDERSVPLRIHALLDDASRYIVGIEALSTEQKPDMLALLVKAIRSHGRPDTLYLDNGSTYKGDILRVACGRLGIELRHTRPRDPQARGKIERFFRTLREGCLDHLGTMASLHDVQVRLLAFVAKRYHVAPHASLMGRSPAATWNEHRDAQQHVSERELTDALTVRQKRRLRQDSTLSVGGLDWETDSAFLRGTVIVARSLVDPQAPPWIEHNGKEHRLRPVDPKSIPTNPSRRRVQHCRPLSRPQKARRTTSMAHFFGYEIGLAAQHPARSRICGEAPKSNAHRDRPRRHVRRKKGVDAVSFDPNVVLLDQTIGRRPGGKR